jgi:hypothetical protein
MAFAGSIGCEFCGDRVVPSQPGQFWVIVECRPAYHVIGFESKADPEWEVNEYEWQNIETVMRVGPAGQVRGGFPGWLDDRFNEVWGHGPVPEDELWFEEEWYGRHRRGFGAVFEAAAPTMVYTTEFRHELLTGGEPMSTGLNYIEMEDRELDGFKIWESKFLSRLDRVDYVRDSLASTRLKRYERGAKALGLNVRMPIEWGWQNRAEQGFSAEWIREGPHGKLCDVPIFGLMHYVQIHQIKCPGCGLRMDRGCDDVSINISGQNEGKAAGYYICRRSEFLSRHSFVNMYGEEIDCTSPGESIRYFRASREWGGGNHDYGVLPMDTRMYEAPTAMGSLRSKQLKLVEAVRLWQRMSCTATPPN